MRNSYYHGHTVGAKVTELRRGSVNRVSIGCVERNLCLGIERGPHPERASRA